MALDFSLDWQQQELQRTARALLAQQADLDALDAATSSEAGFAEVTHARLAELGWLEIGLGAGLASTEPGGRDISDGSDELDDAVNLLVLYEELGRAALGGPHFVCQLAARLLRLLGGPADLIAEIVAGRRIVTVALFEPSGEMFPIATWARAIPGGYVLNGAKVFVPYASSADAILVLARDEDGLSDFYLVDARAGGVSSQQLRTLSGEQAHRLELREMRLDGRARLGAGGSAFPVVNSVLPWVWLIQSAELVGLASAAMEAAVDYAKQRIAFGHPIGSYQAIQHKCAEMVADVDAARYLTYQSACLVNMGASDDVRIPMARSFAADAARRVTKEAHQIFAGSGYMLTSRLHYYYRRAKSIGMAYSGSDDLLDRVADHLIGVLDSAAIPAG